MLGETVRTSRLRRGLRAAPALLAALLAAACAAPPGPVRSAGFSGTSAQPGERSRAPASAPPAAPRLGKGEPAPLSGVRGVSELTSAECLDELRRTDVAFQPLTQLRGVETPVEIRGPIGPVTFWVLGGQPLRLDCRMALALRRLGPLFARHGLTRARYSGAYVYRTTRSGRLSHHAHGLALDLHDLELGGRSLSVKKDFRRAVGCDSVESELNRLACSLREAGIFEELLTPDYNADHHDHLHLAVARGPVLSFERERALTAAREQRTALERSARAVAAARKSAASTSTVSASPAPPAASSQPPASPAAPPVAAPISPAAPAAASAAQATATSPVPQSPPAGDEPSSEEAPPEPRMREEAEDEALPAPPPPPPLDEP